MLLLLLLLLYVLDVLDVDVYEAVYHFWIDLVMAVVVVPRSQELPWMFVVHLETTKNATVSVWIWAVWTLKVGFWTL